MVAAPINEKILVYYENGRNCVILHLGLLQYYGCTSPCYCHLNTIDVIYVHYLEQLYLRLLKGLFMQKRNRPHQKKADVCFFSFYIPNVLQGKTAETRVVPKEAVHRSTLTPIGAVLPNKSSILKIEISPKSLVNMEKNEK
jgi:hypothetical protein